MNRIKLDKGAPPDDRRPIQFRDAELRPFLDAYRQQIGRPEASDGIIANLMLRRLFGVLSAELRRSDDAGADDVLGAMVRRFIGKPV